MSDVQTTTRISELPENITVQLYPNQQQSQQQDNGLGNAYIPINVHPNPYGGAGASGQIASLPYPQSDERPNRQSGSGQSGGGGLPAYHGQQPDFSQPISQMMQSQQQQQPQFQSQSQQQQLRLPSRDIPMDTTQFQQDHEIQPNYIPKAKLTSDYIKNYEESGERARQDHESHKHRANMTDQFFTEFQTPALIMFLFFCFQMPIVNTMLYKYFTFLSIYNSDGNVNFYGVFFKSILFGLLYYAIAKTTDYLANI